MELEMVLSSSCRRNIIKTLLKFRQVSIMTLVAKVNSTYSQVNPNVQILLKEGIITEKRLGHKRIIILNVNDSKTEVLVKVLKIFEEFKTQNSKNIKKKKEVGV